MLADRNRVNSNMLDNGDQTKFPLPSSNGCDRVAQGTEGVMRPTLYRNSERNYLSLSQWSPPLHPSYPLTGFAGFDILKSGIGPP